MAVTIKRFTRLAVYAFFLILTALVSAVLGGKRSHENSSSFSLVPTAAQADVPAAGDGAGADGAGGDSGGSCGSSASGAGDGSDGQ